MANQFEPSRTMLPGQARAITEEAYIYGFPLVDSCRILYAYFVDTNNPEFKAPWNQIRNMPRVFTSDDKAAQTPNSDTPYSGLGLPHRRSGLEGRFADAP